MLTQLESQLKNGVAEMEKIMDALKSATPLFQDLCPTADE